MDRKPLRGDRRAVLRDVTATAIIDQAVTKDLSSSSKFSGSCVLTLQTLLEEDGCWLITEILGDVMSVLTDGLLTGT